MRILRQILVTLGLLAAPVSWAAEASISLPDEPVLAGDTFEIPVYVSDDAVNLASYALRLNYPPDMFNVVEITGGIAAGFKAAPVTDPSKFASGETDFTAVNEGFVATPQMFEVARIRMQAVGRPGDAGAIGLTITPNGGLVDDQQFALLETTLAGDGVVEILDDGSTSWPPNPPANLAGRARGSLVTLTWTGSDDASNFRIYRELVGSDEFELIDGTVERMYTDTIPSGIGYAQYYVIAENVYGDSEPSSTVGVAVTVRTRSTRSRR